MAASSWLNPAQAMFFLPAVVSSAAGTIHYPLPIPEDVIGDVHFQWLRLLPNQTQTSPGRKLSIR